LQILNFEQLLMVDPVHDQEMENCTFR